MGMGKMWGGGGGIVEAEIGGGVKLLTLFSHKNK